MLWLLVFYLVALVLLLMTSLWQQDVFTAELVRKWTLDNYDKLFTGQDGLWLRVYGRTRAAGDDRDAGRHRACVPAGVVHGAGRRAASGGRCCSSRSSCRCGRASSCGSSPWRTILGGQGLLNEFLVDVGILDHSSSAFLYNERAIAITWAYVWLPFMVLPIYTALEKIPDSYLEASRDLGAGVLTTFRRVILPLALPGVVAGSIFVFSLTMGDFVAPQLVGGGSQVLGGAIKDRFGVAADFPFGAALASLTLVTLMVFLTITRRRARWRTLMSRSRAEKWVFGGTARWCSRSSTCRCS